MRALIVAVAVVTVGFSGVLVTGQTQPAGSDPLADYVPEGFGGDARGGEGGRIIEVTNLDDAGPGSLREAVRAEGPRIVRFTVGGIIDLEQPLYITRGFLTIDGASAAPYGGITVHGAVIFEGLECHDIIVRHLRIRRGDPGRDCVSVYKGPHRIVFDHCSISWADDENIGINLGHYITVQWCILAEGQIEGEHTKGAHSCGMLAGHGTNHVSIHHCFFTGNVNRNALLTGIGGLGYAGEEFAIYLPLTTFDFRNNLIYNFRGGTQTAEGVYLNVVNNYYRFGPSFPGGAEVHIYPETYYPGSEQPTVYCSGNLGPRRPDQSLDDWALVTVEGETNVDSPYRRDRPFLVPPVTTHPASEVPELVLSQVGAFPRDEVDQRLIEEFRTGTGEAGAGYLQWKAVHGL